MASHTPHWTPLKRISQGSLFALSCLGRNSDAPHGLGFLEPVMSELLDEAEALQANVDRLRNLSQSLKTFNESFASFLYVMDMNALTTDWLQAPTDASSALPAGSPTYPPPPTSSLALVFPPMPLSVPLARR